MGTPEKLHQTLGDQLLKAGYVEEVDTDTPCPQEWLDSRTPLLPQPPS